MLGARPAITIQEAFEQHLTSKQDTKSQRLIAQQLTVLSRHFNNQQHLHELENHHLNRLVFTFREAGLADETIRLYFRPPDLWDCNMTSVSKNSGKAAELDGRWKGGRQRLASCEPVESSAAVNPKPIHKPDVSSYRGKSSRFG
jgi:hypothetical protein